MDSRERILTVLNHEEPDRVPVHDTVWGATVARWRQEGFPADAEPADYFGYEIASISCDFSPRFPIRTLEETEEFIVQTTATGGVRRNFRDISTTPEVIECPIKTPEDWPPIRDRLHPDETRANWQDLRRRVERARENGRFVMFNSLYGYDALQTYIATERLLMAMATDPDWVREMIMTLASLAIEMAKMAMDRGIEFDGFWNFNDMGYRNGLLFSPESYRRTHKEADQMVYSFFHERGKPVFLHSCGNVKELLPELIEVGLDCLQPLEVKAGMGVRELKKEFGGDLTFMGGIDVRAMASEDPSAIENEIASKLEVAKRGGGYIYHSDHSVPKNVSFAQYQRVMGLVREHGQY